MINTTLKRIRAHRPCEEGWKNLLAGLGKTRANGEPLAYATIVRINGLDDAIWCCRADPEHAKEWRLFAVWCARQVQHLMTDPRSLEALDVAERHAHGLATYKELAAARGAAWGAASDAANAAAWAAANAAAWAAANAAWGAASDATNAAAWAAANAAWGAASDATNAAAWAAANAARDAAWDAAWDAARAAQTAKFLRIVGDAKRDKA